MNVSIADKLLSVEEYSAVTAAHTRSELVQGRVVELNPPTPRHGQICAKISRLVATHAEHDLGHVITNDAGIITQRGPDTLRGADVAFYGYDQVPKGPLPSGYLSVAPKVVFEVLSAKDRWPDVLKKTAEYLEAGVLVVSIFDPRAMTVQLHRSQAPIELLQAHDEFTIQEVWGDFGVVARRFFE